MTHNYPVEQVPATPEYVLAVLDTTFRTFVDMKRAYYKPIPLTFEMTVAAWLKRFGFSRSVFQMEGAEWLNALFDLDLPDDEWDQFLFRDDRFTLGDLCQFVASRLGMREIIRPWRSLVGECQAAGAFLALKSKLAASGVDVSDFSPSTPLSDPRFGRRLYDLVVWLIRLAPNSFPVGFTFTGPRGTARLINSLLLLGFGLFLAGFVLIGAGITNPQDGLLFCGSGFATVLVAFVLAWRSPMWPVIPGMRSYSDLAYALAGQRPRRRVDLLDTP